MSGITDQIRQQILARAQAALRLPAAESGKTAIFYSNPNNDIQASECRDQYPDHYYKIQDTQMGRALATLELERWVYQGVITAAEYDAIFLQASRQFAQQASGPVIAFVSGTVNPGSYFVRAELVPLLTNNSVSSINGVSRGILASSLFNGDATQAAIVAQLGMLAMCFDPNSPPPSASAPVTPLDRLSAFGAAVILLILGIASTPLRLVPRPVLPMFAPGSARNDLEGRANTLLSLANSIAPELARLEVAGAVASRQMHLSNGSQNSAAAQEYLNSSGVDALRALLASSSGSLEVSTVDGNGNQFYLKISQNDNNEIIIDQSNSQFGSTRVVYDANSDGVGTATVTSSSDGVDDGTLQLGSIGNDLLIGGPQHDTLVGGAGADELRGEGDADWLIGGDGPDVLHGHLIDGNYVGDTLEGGRGNDVLTGSPEAIVFGRGDGHDSFAWTSPTGEARGYSDNFRVILRDLKPSEISLSVWGYSTGSGDDLTTYTFLDHITINDTGDTLFFPLELTLYNKSVGLIGYLKWTPSVGPLGGVR